MEPVYHDGQIVWVKKTDTLQSGEVGVFLCKKVYDQQEPAEKELEEYVDSYGLLHPQVVLVSYNEKYEPIAYFLR